MLTVSVYDSHSRLQVCCVQSVAEEETLLVQQTAATTMDQPHTSHFGPVENPKGGEFPHNVYGISTSNEMDSNFSPRVHSGPPCGLAFTSSYRCFQRLCLHRITAE